MRTRTALQWPAVLLAAAALSIQAPDADAKGENDYGPAVDAFCKGPQGNGSRPFEDYNGSAWIDDSDRRCGLCHGPTSLKKQPQFDWYKNGTFSLFCPQTPNSPPTAANDSDSTDEDVMVTITVLTNDTDADGDTLSVSSVTQGANGSVTNNGDNLSYTPDADFNGPDNFTYTASDGKGGSDTATVNVTVTPVNDPPEVTDPGDQAGFEGQSVSLQIGATDLDSGGTLSYSASGLPTGLVIAAGSGLISGTPADGSSSTSPYAVTITVRDGGTPVRSNSIGFSWSVSAINQPPTITSKPVTTATEGAPYSYQITAEDEGPLTYSLGTTTPSGMTVSASGLVQWTPSGSQIGMQLATVTVTDDGGESASQTFTVEVKAAPVPPEPVTCSDDDGDGFSPDGGICGPVDSSDDNLAINPGRAEICDDGIDNDSDGDTDASDSECDGSNCLAGLFGIVNITLAEWNAAASELQVRGNRCTSGSPVVLRNADSGALLDNTVVDNIGAWLFSTAIGNATAVPCRVRVEFDENSGESDVANAPVNCDDGRGAVPNITRAVWKADKKRLRVVGDGAESGEIVTVYNVTNDASLGTTTVRGDGSWRFRRSNPTPVPCAVRVEIAGRSAERDVRNAPDNCAADPTPVVTPGVVGQGQGDAESAIVAAGLSVGTVTEQSSETVAAGNVISQSPVGGTSVAPHSAVDLVVSTGRAPPPADFSIDSASWKASDRKLLVIGSDGPRGQGPATLFSADGSVVLGQTKVEDDGKWKFEVEKPQLVPCLVRVEIGNSAAVRAVSNAPANCFE